ncbi:MAG TPA: hypothetical protein VD999_07380 [Vitreimonas sp.]|nr:hypothetical protein [Vitreimonas sp.]
MSNSPELSVERLIEAKEVVDRALKNYKQNKHLLIDSSAPRTAEYYANEKAYEDNRRTLLRKQTTLDLVLQSWYRYIQETNLFSQVASLNTFLAAFEHLQAADLQTLVNQILEPT